MWKWPKSSRMKYHIIRVEIRKRAYGESEKKPGENSDCGTLFDYKYRYYSNKYGIKLEA